MKRSISLFLSLSLVWLSCTACLCQVTTVRNEPVVDTLLIQKATFIGLVQVISYDNDKLICSASICFKGVERYPVFRVLGSTPDFDEGEQFLVYAGVDNDGKLYIAGDSRVVDAEDSGREIDFLLSFLPCIDLKMKENRANGFCHRVLSPVCGCDGVQYGNECEAFKAGVVMFKAGGCK